MTINVLEVRNYLLKPHMLEHFVDYFEAHFIASQHAAKMHVLGQFRVLSEPDHFVWLRGFSDMQTRLEGLQNFYGGPVWKKYGTLANEMMLDSDNVHLLRPLSRSVNLTDGLSAESIAVDFDAGTISPYTGIVAIDFYRAAPGLRDVLIDKFQAQVVPAYEDEGIQVRGFFVAEMSENDFPRLPVIQNEDELAVITAFESEETCVEKRTKVSPLIDEITGGLLSAAPDSLLLSPTLRSPMRFSSK